MPVSIMSPTPGTRTPRRVQWASKDHVHEPEEPVNPHSLDELAQDVSTLLFVFNCAYLKRLAKRV
jgi:hypothetical protein